jgi:hypothetical protein
MLHLGVRPTEFGKCLSIMLQLRAFVVRSIVLLSRS